MANPKIKSVSEFGKKLDHIAVLTLESGQEQRPPWIDEYKDYAVDAEGGDVLCEYINYSISGEYLVVCMTWADGQGGGVAVWSCGKEEWIYCGDQAYAMTALFIKQEEILVSLSSWYQNNQLQGTLDAYSFEQERGSRELDLQWSSTPLDLSRDSITLQTTAETDGGRIRLSYSSASSILYLQNFDQYAQVNIENLLKEIQN